MTSQILPLKFFRRPALEMAPALIGCNLVVRRADGQIIKQMITEVEAYDGEADLANHASRGRTKRTEVMYRPGGVFYIYLIYGMYQMLNIVVDQIDYPAAVLIRSTQDVSGPGRLTRALGITRELNGRSVQPKSGVWVESGLRSANLANRIVTTPRIGVSYAGPWARKPFRFVLSNDYLLCYTSEV